MKNFKIYVNNFGWQKYTLKSDLYEAKREVARLINKDQKVMVIEHDTDTNSDDVIPTQELFKMKTLENN